MGKQGKFMALNLALSYWLRAAARPRNVLIAGRRAADYFFAEAGLQQAKRRLEYMAAKATGAGVIPGTPIFDGTEAQKGYALNKMCYSFNDAAAREEFLRDEDAYCEKFGLSAAQRAAVRKRNVLDLIASGGNIYYLAKFAGIFGWDVQDVGAQQTGMSVEDFKAMLVEAGE
jgi:protocatechuate 4,5-dioxygenase alpha chain